MKRVVSNWMSAVAVWGAICMGGAGFALDCEDYSPHFCEVREDWSVGLSVDIPFMETCEPVHFARSRITVNQEEIVHGVSFDEDVGIRAAALVNFPSLSWNLNFEYTYLSTGGKMDLKNPIGNTLHTYLGGDHAVTKSTFELKMESQLMDTVISRACYPYEDLEMVPFVGLRALIVDREGVESSLGATLSSVGDGGRAHHDYTGYGIVAGFHWNHCVFAGFSLLGKLAGSALVGDNAVHLTRIQGGSTVAQYRSNVDCHPVASIETGLGLGYDAEVCDSEIHLSLCYEMSHWTHFGSLIPLSVPESSPPSSPFTPGADTTSFTQRGVVLGMGVSF